MDRVSELRGTGAGAGAGETGAADSTLDTTSPPSEAFMSANETSSKYFSLSDSTFDIAPIKDVSLASTAAAHPDDDADNSDLISNLSPIGKKDLDTFKIGKQIEAANILSGGVDIFDDNDNSFDGNELVIDDNVEIDDKSDQKDEDFKPENSTAALVSTGDTPGKDTEVVLQIDGKNVDAIDIGNGLYLYRKDGREELAAVQIIDDGQNPPTFKFLKVRENAEGNLEVYEEIEIEIPKEVPTKEEAGSLEKKTPQLPVTDNKVPTDAKKNKVVELKKTPPTASTSEETDVKETFDKPELNLNGKMMKFSESRTSSVVGSFTPMTYHSTPNKEGKPLTKTMVDLQLHPNRHSDNVKKTIEVHTDSTKLKPVEAQTKKPLESTKMNESLDTTDKPIELTPVAVKSIEKIESIKQMEFKIDVKDSETKHKESSENKTEVNEEVTIKPIVDQLLIDEDIESNEAGILVIDEKQQPNPIEMESEIKDRMQNEQKLIIPEVAKETNILIPAPEPIENKEDISIESADKKEGGENIEKPMTLNKLNIEKSDESDKYISESKSTEVIDAKKTDLPKNTNDKNIEPFSDSKKDTMTTQESKQVLELTQNKKLSDKPISLSEKTEKSVEKADNRKQIDAPKCNEVKSNEKLESSEPSSSNLGSVAYKTDVPQVVDNIQENKPIVSHTMSNVPTIPKPKVEQNKIGINISVPIQGVQKPPVKIPDPKVIAKSEPVLRKEIITNKQDAVVDIKPSSAELSKTIESKNTTDISKAVESNDKKDIIVAKPNSDVKPINNNHTAVPFGKWTEVNRQEFLNKFKEHKAPINTNSKQIKNSNDLNRRDVLKKIDSQRQSNIASSKDKPPPVKNETIFSNKVSPTKAETKIPVKKDGIEVKHKVIESVKNVTKQETTKKSIKPLASSTVSSSTTAANVPKKEPSVQNELFVVPSASPSVSKPELPRREVNVSELSHREVNVESLINKTIEEMLNKVTSFPPLPSKPISDEAKQLDKKDQIAAKVEKKSSDLKSDKPQHSNKKIKILDDIEIKMNELHGIPFVERPAHELPKVQLDVKASSTSDLENTLSKNIKTTKNEVTNKKSEIIEVDSEEEVIEHEPITGDIELNNETSNIKLPSQEVDVKMSENPTIRNEVAKKAAVITEKEFDKFARRNSVTYDNCVTLNLEAKDSQNPVSNVRGRETFSTINPKKEFIHLEPKSKLHPIRPHNTYSRKPLPNASVSGDSNSKNYQSKIHIAYQSVLTAKMDRQTSRPVERPITIIEDKPVKVVFMDASAEFVPGQLNVQGKELSPAKKYSDKLDALTVSTTESVDKPERTEEIKQNDDTKTKTKHQRKQVLTPVDAPELELIQPGDIGIEVSPKKKRKTEDYKTDKHYKNLTHKKSYLLGRSTTTDEKTNSDLSHTLSNNENKIDDSKIVNVNTATALDNLVKAAELIENQESMNTCVTPSSDSSQNTPVKRGRGRPRKYPLSITPTDDTKVPSPQKKPRLIDAKLVKENSISDDDSLDGEIVKENWTMGKINENIVCPICNKLFRSENVVFKHVKHCTGVSPSRSETDKRSSQRDRRSQESDIKSLDSRSDDMDIDSDEKLSEAKKRTPKKRKSRDPLPKIETDSTESASIDDALAEQTQEGVNKIADEQQKEIKNVAKTKVPQRSNNLVCEFCGKTFRQLSYLVSHRLQHKREKEKKDAEASNKPQVFSCEVCKKEFRKLHHLVQHRIIHNPNTMPSRSTRKTSAEHNENKTTNKEDTTAKPGEDPSAAFRCEPCDKSFRKLHHLVEHRETHDGINRQKVSTTATAVLEKPPPPPQCDVCKKTFRKLHHLIEHKEQHAETSSEKSDDKSVKSALSTKDIIHECPLCYMVFPNEHSLNKHSGICQRKKRQSKLAKNIADEDGEVNDENLVTDDKNIKDNGPKIVAVEVIDDSDNIVESKEDPTHGEKEEVKNTSTNTKDTKPTNEETKSTEMKSKEKTPLRDIQDKVDQNDPIIIEAPTAVTETDEKENEIESNLKENVTIADKVKNIEEKHVNKTPALRKKTPIKDKIAPTVTRRRRTADATLSIVTKPKPALESSDDDEIRYMFNPKFKVEQTIEGKEFMKVRANKRNSLQIERPNSKDLVTRRTSLQHPPKIPRLKPKPIEPKIVPSQTAVKTVQKIPKTETALSTDSDDSDVKYSFPKTVSEKPPKPVPEVEKKPGRKSLADKRKSLSGIAKRKSMGQSLAAKNKHKPSPVQPIRKRTREVEHRCDCGQLFSSAALLSRHTSLAHTPPRIRRRRSPPPEPVTQSVKRSSVKVTTPTTSKQAVSSRKSIKSAAPSDVRKSMKPDNSKPKSSTKASRTAPAHSGVPVPEKMRKLMLKNKK